MFKDKRIEYTPLLISTAVSENIGMNEAIILARIGYWCSVNKDDYHYKEGHYWMYNSISKWIDDLKQFGMRRSTIQSAIKTLEDNNLIITGSFNSKPYDRTKWYRVNEEEIVKLQEDGLKVKEQTISDISEY